METWLMYVLYGVLTWGLTEISKRVPELGQKIASKYQAVGLGAAVGVASGDPVAAAVSGGLAIATDQLLKSDSSKVTVPNPQGTDLEILADAAGSSAGKVAFTIMGGGRVLSPTGEVPNMQAISWGNPQRTTYFRL